MKGGGPVEERELGALFQQAASGTAPPASFDEQDVIRGSRRVTARRRVLAGGGSLVAAALVVGGVGVGTSGLQEDRSTVASPPAAPQAQAPQQGPQQVPQQGGASIESHGGGASVLSSPTGTGGCGPADPAVAAAVARQLPEAGQVPPHPATDCPPGSRAAEFQVHDASGSGRLTVVLAPASSGEQPRAESPGPRGSTQVADRTRSGRVLVLRTSPEAGSDRAPYGERLGQVAQQLASGL